LVGRPAANICNTACLHDESSAMPDGARTMVWLGSGSAAGSLRLLLEGQHLGRTANIFFFEKECVWLIMMTKVVGGRDPLQELIKPRENGANGQGQTITKLLGS
jgi:hypothetical protein